MKSSLLLASILVTTGCSFDPYSLFGSGDAGNGNGLEDGGPTGDSGGLPDAGPGADAGPDAAVDPCDGLDLENDPANCGACGRVCVVLPGAIGSCVQGDCVYGCLSNFHDLNQDLNTPGSNGCEYGPCVPTGPEICNLIDDDCNGLIDDDIDGLDSDPQNCGACFHQCAFVNVEETACVDGICGYTECKVGFADIAEVPAGCEYQCPVFPPLEKELCNGIDDTCDGQIDNLPIDGLGEPCYPDNVEGCTIDPGGNVTCKGQCQVGTTACSFGVPICSGFVTPQPERCDNLDWDCDGLERNGFDTENNPNHCGDACIQCKSVSVLTGAPGELLNAIPGCVEGQCVAAGCLPGFVDADPDVPGCEYLCTKTSDVEFCDGKDNTCDGKIDEPFFVPDGFTCSIPGTPCEDTPVSCTECGGVTTLRCDYSVMAGTETDACGNLRFQETRCDGIDGDCDGLVDESFPVGHTCDDGELGICRSIGEFVCNEAENGVECDIDPDNPTHTIGLEPRPEECNNLDDDCDGIVDNFDTTPGVGPNDVVGVDTSGDGNPNFYVFTYEGSRPDASADGVGIAGHRACSKPGVLPWVSVTWSQAQLACQNAGARLCTAEEWRRACAGAAGDLYPYGTAYEPLSCNGHDYHHCPGPGDPQNQESLLPTGFDYDCPPAEGTCVSADGVFDLSGNAKEWVADESTPGSGAFGVRGGAYDNVAAALTCDNASLFFQDATAFPNLGFRCCFDAP